MKIFSKNTRDIQMLMNLKNLSDEILLTEIQKIAAEERELTIKILHHLREMERRSLFAKLGYSSLFEYCVQELKYSVGAAQRRISSMRLLKEVPELEEKIEKGIVNLSILSQAQSFFRQEKTVSVEAKREVLLCLEGKSKREVERELVARSSEPEKLSGEKIRAVSPTHTELKLIVEAEVLQKIEELKGLIGHSKPNASLKDVVSYALDCTLKQIRPKAPKALPIDKSLPPVEVKASPKTRYIPVEVKRQVWQRDRGQCTYMHRGRKCSCKQALEFDHIRPHALGGLATVENLRLRCKSHNQLAAVQIFGQKKMAQYVPRLK